MTIAIELYLISSKLLPTLSFWNFPSLKSTSFVIIAMPTCKQATTFTKIPKQYEEFQDVFEKKDVDILLKH